MNTVKLQGIYGQQKGTPAGEVKVGEVIRWNYDYKSQVLARTETKSGKSVVLTLKSLESGNINNRTMRKESLVVIAG